MVRRRRRKLVSFWGTKKVTKPVKIKFRRASGEKVSFSGHKTVTKRVRISFLAKRKRRR